MFIKPCFSSGFVKLTRGGVMYNYTYYGSWFISRGLFSFYGLEKGILYEWW